MTSAEYYKAGQLAEATRAALEEVRSNPGDVAARSFLSDLLCFGGELERADRQLDAAMRLGPAPRIQLRQQLIRAEQARRQFFAQGGLPELVEDPGSDLRLRLQAVMALRDGDTAGASKLLGEAVACQAAVKGTCNGQPFGHFRDFDEFTASCFEVFTATGKYYWIGFNAVAKLEFVAPRTTLDLLWRCARLELRKAQTGPDTERIAGVVYLPVLYVGSHSQGQEGLKLGRFTDWSGGGAAPLRGLGQRIFQAGPSETPILELAGLEFGDGAEV